MLVGATQSVLRCAWITAVGDRKSRGLVAKCPNRGDQLQLLSGMRESQSSRRQEIAHTR
jgi:hypothetical protein